MFREGNDISGVRLRRWCTSGINEHSFCGAVLADGEFLERTTSNHNGGYKKSWYCPACDCRWRPFANGQFAIVEVFNTDTHTWMTALTNPPPEELQISMLTLLKWKYYRELIDEWGDIAQQLLPKFRIVGARRPSIRHPEQSYRFAEFTEPDKEFKLDWFVLAGLSVGWRPEKTRQMSQMVHSAKKFARIIHHATFLKGVEMRTRAVQAGILDVESDDDMDTINGCMTHMQKRMRILE